MDISSDLTAICIWTNEKQAQFLQHGLSAQGVNCFAFVDNSGNRYQSAATALNYAVSQVTTPYCLILHQDIVLEDQTIASFASFLETLEDGDILGVAGTSNDAKEVYTNTYFDYNRKPAGKFRLEGRMACDVVDECFFGARTETFRVHPFDEQICRHFHLYAVEQCLYAKSHGHQVYICETALWHVSHGWVDMKFAGDFWKLCKAYRNQYSYIKTNCERSATDAFSCLKTWCSRLWKNTKEGTKNVVRKVLRRPGRRETAMRKVRKEVWGI